MSRAGDAQLELAAERTRVRFNLILARGIAQVEEVIDLWWVPARVPGEL